MKKINRGLTSVLTVVSVTAAINDANAAGFKLNETSSKLMGQALAGSAATTDDITTMFNNPASLGYITKNEVAVVGHVIFPTIKFKNNGSRSVATPLIGGNGGNAGSTAFVPAAYLAWNCDPNLKFGISITAPWGLATEWDNGWVGRYHSIKSELKTININPSVAYKVSDSFSIGAGVQIQYAEAELTRGIDFGTLDALGSFAPLPAGFFGLTPQGSDGRVRLRGDDWSLGANVGAIYKIFEHTKLGLSYRSPVSHKLDGRVNYTFPTNQTATILGNTATFTNQKATAKLKTPESVTLSGVHEFNDRWSAMADITYTKWSRFKEVRVVFREIPRSDDVTSHRFKNVMFYSLGANWKALDNLTVRAGIAYDESPVRSALRHPSVPDSDRTWLTAGLTWTAMQDLNVGLNYAHVFIKNGSSNLRPTGTDAIKGSLIGRYKSHVDIIGAQVNWKF